MGVPRAAVTGLALVAGAGLLVGCGSGGASHPSADKTTYAPFGTVHGSVVPQAMVFVSHCDVAPGPVTATGTAKNPGSAARDYVVDVRWLLPGTGRTLAQARTELTSVAPGATVDWTVSARLPGHATAECLPTASLATPGGAPSGDPGGSP